MLYPLLECIEVALQLRLCCSTLVPLKCTQERRLALSLQLMTMTLTFFASTVDRLSDMCFNVTIKENGSQQTSTASQTKEVLDQVNIQNEHLSEEQKEQLQTVLTNFTDVFQTSGSPLGHYSGVKHCIDSGHHRPIRSRPYRHPPHLRQIIRDQIQQMLNDKIISPSTSPWSSSIVLVRHWF